VQQRNPQQEPTDPGKPADRSSRRKLLKTGALLVPPIVTLYGRAAFGQGADLNRQYASADYKYGTFEGMNTFDRIDLQHGGGGEWDPDPEIYPNESSYTYTDSEGTEYIYTFKN